MSDVMIFFIDIKFFFLYVVIFMVGDFRIIVIFDGYLQLIFDLLQGVLVEEYMELLCKVYFLKFEYIGGVVVFLIEFGDCKFLIDVGIGVVMGLMLG